MSSRYEGDPHEPVLAEEDDWFATPFPLEPSETDEVAWQDDEPEPPPRRTPDGLAQRQIVVVLAVVAVVAVIAIMILIVRAVGGGSDGTPATTATTTATTPTVTTPTTTTPTTTTPTTPTTTTPTTTVTAVPADQSLKPGMTGSSVTALQQALTQLGYKPGTPDGSYGPATTQAVTAFQADKGLTQDGIAGTATLTAINTALSAG